MWSSVEPGTRSRGGGAEWRGGGAGELREVTITQPVIRKRSTQDELSSSEEKAIDDFLELNRPVELSEKKEKEVQHYRGRRSGG